MKLVLYRILLLVSLLVLTGCGSGGIAPVAGVVTLDSKPLPNANIVFTPVGEGRPSVATSDAQGNYTLEYTSGQSGALIGEHIVSVTTGGEQVDEQGNEYEGEEKVPTQFNSDATYKKTVESGTNVINLDLTSQGSIVQANQDVSEDNNGDDDDGGN